MENMENLNQEKVSPKHVFLHLFVIIMLYATTINFLTLLFQYINVWIPDPLSEIGYYSASRYYDIIRFALSSFIIVFPVFILTSWFLNRNYSKNPAVFDMKIRKWLIYFTLFVAALVIIGDLVRIVFVFLEGEITLRFTLKALSVLLVTGLIFGYYLWNVRRTKPFHRHKYFVWTIIAIALVTVIAGFFIIGSPKTERLRRFDDQRINDLDNIQWQIIEYWQRKEKLPETLDELTNEISGYQAPVDPQTGLPYWYIKKEENSFELCAEFNLGRDERGSSTRARIPKPLGARELDWNWEHTAGRTCFERTIDKELYPPYNEDDKAKNQLRPIPD